MYQPVSCAHLQALSSVNRDTIVTLSAGRGGGGGAFHHSAPKHWNSLPHCIRGTSSAASLKKPLKTHQFQLAYYPYRSCRRTDQMHGPLSKWEKGAIEISIYYYVRSRIGRSLLYTGRLKAMLQKCLNIFNCIPGVQQGYITKTQNTIQH